MELLIFRESVNKDMDCTQGTAESGGEYFLTAELATAGAWTVSAAKRLRAAFRLAGSPRRPLLCERSMDLKTRLHAKYRGLRLLLLFAFLTSCSSIDPRKVDVEMPQTFPRENYTSYTTALGELGLMTEIYATPYLKIQCIPVGDNTGASLATGAEIPRDITEMMKSALNLMGGKIIYIPYDSCFIQNQIVTGYSKFEQKVIPDVVLSGGITEFDRGLETRSENTDASVGAEVPSLSDSFPSKSIELRYGGARKSGLASITLDFNLLDFRTMTGIPKITALNTMKVFKALRDEELAIGIFGLSYGVKGEVKKVQGRHAAVRLLVELSMIQIVGKHLLLPYWRLLGEDALPDPMVLDGISEFYACLTPREIIADVQEWLCLYGYPVNPNGRMDAATREALRHVCQKELPADGHVDLDTFTCVYVNIPITRKAKAVRKTMPGASGR